MNDFNNEKQKDLIPINEQIDLPFTDLSKQFDNRPIRDFLKCQNCLNGNVEKSCPNYAKCPYIIRDIANTIINRFKDFDEIVFYKNNFELPNGTDVIKDIDRTRKWIKDETGVLSPIDENIKLEDLKKTLFDSRKRSLDNLYGYVLCNDWQYFVTITFKHGKTKKLSDEVVKYQWQKFRQQLQYRFPDIKILLVPEDTPNGVHGMHFHGFMGNADLGDYLCPARNNKKFLKDGSPNLYYGEMMYTEYGDPIFNFLPSFVNVGYTTIVKIKDCNNLKLINYITKYLNKDSSNFDYNENSYLRTYNLDFKQKEVCMFTKKQKEDLINSLFVQKYKETDKFIVYRRFFNEGAK